MSDIDRQGVFYLGREHDLASGTTHDDPILYDSKNLTTHAVCVGMTGSGKTGLCISLLEEAALDGIPAIAIDPKGDLGNLLLTFPNFLPSDFRPWIDESEAQRTGLSLDDLATKSASDWRDGLAEWDEGPERVQKFNDRVERLIFTPGSTAGIPLTVLKSFGAPPAAIMNDPDLLRERISAAASGLLALVGVDVDPVQSREHIFLSNVLDAAWRAGRNLDLASLIREIQQPSFTQVGVMDLESFYPTDQRMRLSMTLNNLLASPSFAGWMEGMTLDVQQLFYSPEGKPRLSVISIAHLSDAERMFFVTILLNEILAWMRSQPGTSSLRAILYMDEIFGYFPPLGNPPTKIPMLTLLKQARAFGLGCVLATQNPVDLDYKGLSNAGTWFLGRLQTERDKMRVIEGLEGASAQAGSTFNKQQMEATLAGLGNRVFLMNNVHQEAPRVFQTRWAMSYLRGPMTRGQIKQLMDPVRAKFAVTKTPPPALMSETSAPPPQRIASVGRPILPGGITEQFVKLSQPLAANVAIEYRPVLIGIAKLHFIRAAYDIDLWREYMVVQPCVDHLSAEAWRDSEARVVPLDLSPEPESRCTFASLPTELTQEKNYKEFAKELKEYLFQTESIFKWRCEALARDSDVNESESAFRQRLQSHAAETLKLEQEKLHVKYDGKLKDADAKIAKAQTKYNEQRSQFWGRIFRFFTAILDTLLAVVGGRATRRRSSTSVTAAQQAVTERSQAVRAEDALKLAIETKEQLEQERDKEIAMLPEKLNPMKLSLERLDVSARKTDTDIQQLLLAWLPYRLDAAGDAIALWEEPKAATVGRET